MSKPPAVLKRPDRRKAAPPTHLERTEKTLWKDLNRDYAFDDSASLAMLRTACEAHQRSRRCREAIDRDGEAVKDRFEQLKPHPLLAAERDARAAFIAAMRVLNLDLGSDGQ